MGPVKDEKYYFDDGDCTFLVDGVLFKLHKFNLYKNPDSAFRTMFEDAKGDASEIIPLYDATEDFRALCWVIYAPLSEIFHLTTHPDDVPVSKYLSILEIAHKYALLDIETWAWGMARLVSSRVPVHLDTCSEDDLQNLMGLAVRCASSAPELLVLVETAWFARIKRAELPYSRALTVGEFYGRRSFQADVYMELREKLVAGPTWTSPTVGLLNFKLTKVQSDCLLLGHAILSNQTGCIQSLLSQQLPQQNGAYHSNHYYCESQWRGYSQSSISTNPATAIAVIEQASQSCGYPCVKVHLESILVTLREHLPTNTADYFLCPAVDALSRPPSRALSIVSGQSG
ncbi:hypothetical protein C8F01DRAFT_1112417 [Mycena amicta]|nr:hypothetical protein C8F01DRAFT_1112417 [Mycena amicta]